MPNLSCRVRRKKILVIEDDADLGQVLVIRLGLWGYEGLYASDGKQGFERARSEAPDLIILDLTLPNLSGQEVCKAIREDTDRKFAHTPILMLTGHRADADKLIGYVIGANCYIIKPFDEADLLRSLQLLIRDPGLIIPSSY